MCRASARSCDRSLSAITLRRGGLDDLPFFMATERLPGYQGKVGRWPEEEHRTALASPTQAYLIGLDEDRTQVAFAIIQAIGDAHGNAYLKRIAVTQPGQGVGRRFLAAATGWVFRETDAHRFWLEVLADNARARHVYQTSGFAEEGAARDAYLLADGTRVDLVVMSILRSEWNDQEN
jgi:diamine N-acetyltransferase